ncbi:ER membrane protein complex subunit 2-like [Oscarella lobularis]|uniref:ER membrane protein complex subunit 2-like n=1 Tax=Oscarella lobularis TaxID=121494 RepID=UPI0033139425
MSHSEASGGRVEDISRSSEDVQLDWREARERLKEFREAKNRDSLTVLKIGKPLVEKNRSRLGDELWIVFEQLFLAALDCGKQKLAQFYSDELKRQFPKSLRVRRLRGMYLESIENYDEALEVYDEILKEDSTYGLARKRKVAVLKAKQDVAEAIEALTEYLKDFMSDHEAWLELADLYISQLDFKHAAFCMEELILVNPHMPLFHQRYAEILYSMGGTDNMELARKYFAQALKLNPDSTRSLCGFFMASSALKSKKDSKSMATWAQEKLLKAYTEKDSELRGIAEKVMQSVLSGTEKETRKPQPQRVEVSEFEFKMNTGQSV